MYKPEDICMHEKQQSRYKQIEKKIELPKVYY